MTDDGLGIVTVWQKGNQGKSTVFTICSRGDRRGAREEFLKGDYKGQLLGDDNFVPRVLELAEIKAVRSPSLGTIIAKVCREAGVSKEKLRVPGISSQAAQARWMVGLLAMNPNSASLTEVARYFGRDVTIISDGVRHLRERSNED